MLLKKMKKSINSKYRWLDILNKYPIKINFEISRIKKTQNCTTFYILNNLIFNQFLNNCQWIDGCIVR